MIKGGDEEKTTLTLLLFYSLTLILFYPIMITYWRVWSVLAFVQPC